TASGSSIVVKLHPRARKDAVIGSIGDALKISLTAPPVEGRANQALVEFVAELLNVPRSSVKIAAGQSSRRKVVVIAGLLAEEAARRLRPFLTPDT
ncbi:MAG: DUF167 domain-containing protein, partial [Terriglobales bacterium]